MDPLRNAAIEQSAYDRQARMRDEAHNDFLTRAEHANESATPAARKLRLVLALTAAIIVLLLVTAFVVYTASATGGGTRWLFY